MIFAGQGVPTSFFQGGTALNLYRDFINDPQLNGPNSNYRVGPNLSFKRNSYATYVDSLCTIRAVFNDVPRFNYSPDGQYLGLLIEPPVTNFVTYSGIFQTDWTFPLTADNTEQGATVTNDLGISLPVDFVNLDPQASVGTKLASTSGVGYHVISWGELPVPPNEEIELSNFYTRSIFVKKDTARYLCVTVGPVPSAESITSIFDFEAAEGPRFISDSTLNTFTIPYRDDWYRIGFTRLTTNSNTNRLTIGIANGPEWTDCVFDGSINNLSSVYIWGAQAELGLTPTSYIPTFDTATSRAGDDITINRRAFSLFYNPSASSIFIQANNPKIKNNTTYITYINTLSSNEWTPEETETFRQQLIQNNIPSHSFTTFTNNISTQYWTIGSVLSGNVNSLINTSMLGTINTPAITGDNFIVAAGLLEDNFILYQNQTLINTVTSGTLPQPPIGINQFNLGRSLNQNYFNGHIQVFGYWPTRLSNQELSEIQYVNI